MAEHDGSEAAWVPIMMAGGFAPGTRMMTGRGEVPVEELVPGDLLVTLSGQGAPLKPLVALRRCGAAAVRILPGALGPGMPARPLRLGAAQPVLVEGGPVAVALLVNDVNILAEPAGDAPCLVPELARPDLVVAEGTPAAALPEAPPGPDAPTEAEQAARLPAIRAAIAGRALAPGARHPADALLDALLDGPAGGRAQDD